MIRIQKPNLAPDILTSLGATEHARMVKEFSADPESYRKFTFDPSIYGAKEVKVELAKCQHGKCCFCESKYQHIDYGDVEHFRPKKAYQQNTGDSLTRPGYFWLAYDWDNLLISCTMCNQRYKGNLFPLSDSACRCAPDKRNISIETPLFINPAIEDPSHFIGFRGAFIFAKNGNERGRVTIEALGLDRKHLNEARADKLEILLALLATVKTAEKPVHAGDAQLQSDAVNARRILNNSIVDKAEYAGMARCALL